MLCNSYESTPSAVTTMFRMTVAGSALTLFHAHFIVENANWPLVDILSTSRYDSSTKQEEVSDEIASLHTSNFREDGDKERGALSNLIDRIAMLNPLAILSDRNDTVQKRFLRSAVRGRAWDLHAEKAEERANYIRI